MSSIHLTQEMIFFVQTDDKRWSNGLDKNDSLWIFFSKQDKKKRDYNDSSLKSQPGFNRFCLLVWKQLLNWAALTKYLIQAELTSYNKNKLKKINNN